MNPLVTYSLARLVIFVGTLGVLVWAGAGQVWAIILAAVISMLLSYVLLRGLRDQVAVQVAERVSRRTAGRGSGPDEQVEDRAVDAVDAVDARTDPRKPSLDEPGA